MSCRISGVTQHLNHANVRLAPSAEHVACIASSNSKLFVSDVASGKVVSIHPCIDRIDKIEWSPDSKFILCAMFSRGAVQIFNIDDKNWNSRINEGLAGMVNARWCPDSLHVLIESDYGIQISIWSLEDSSSYIFAYPKPSPNTLCAFSDCAGYMVIGHRIDLQDYIGFYSTNPWNEIAKFKCKSNDLAHVAFVPASTYIVAADSSLYYRLTVYSPAGEVISHFEPYQNALGLRSFAFIRSASAFASDNSTAFTDSLSDVDTSTVRGGVNLLAIASYDGKVRIMSSRTWELAFILPLVHTKELGVEYASSASVKTTVEVEEGKYTGATVFETDLWGSTAENSDASIMNQSLSLNSTAATANSYVYKNLRSLPRLPSSEMRPANAPPKVGVSALAWAPGTTLLYAREESHPRCLWIWNALEAKLVGLLVQIQAIQSAQWRPCSKRPCLAFCCGTERVYIWTESGPSWINVPVAGMGVTSIAWTSDGTRMIMSSKSSFCTCDFDETEFFKGD